MATASLRLAQARTRTAAWAHRWLPVERRIQAQVFVAGAGIMVLEMLGGRLLAPRFGSTIFTWGALIGVVMTALAAGYYAGGRLGDRWPRPATLSALLFGGAAFALFLPLAGPPLLAGVAGLIPDPRWGPLVATAFLIAPPALLLGAATPVAVRLAARGREEAGTTAGSMAGLSTVGSIVDTFGTVFVLIPTFDTNLILTGTGALLGLAALLGTEQRPMLAWGLAVLLVVTPLGQAALAPALTALSTGITDDILYQESTPYHELYVTQERALLGAGRVRSLMLDGNKHSSMFLDAPAETPIRYVEHFHLGPLLQPNASRALFIGGGGMSGPKQFLEAYPNMTVDVVEVDPGVIEAAHEWFQVPRDEPRLRIHAGDGRQFLARTNATWDVIILDAYGRHYVPFHLMTVEFHSLVLAHLAPRGIVVTNVIGSSEGPTSLLLRAEARTMRGAYGWVGQSFTRPGIGGFSIQNVMLLGAAEPPTLAGAAERAQAWNQEKAPRRFAEVHATLEPLGLRTDDVPLLRDDFAPVETYISPLTGKPYDPAG